MKRPRIVPDGRRPLLWWGVAIVGAILAAGVLLTAWYDRHSAPVPGVPETGGAGIYLPAVGRGHAAYAWPDCRGVADVYAAWLAAGIVDEPLRAAWVVGFDPAVPDGCLPYVRYRAAGESKRGEVYLCASAAESGAVRGARGPGRWMYGCGQWLLTVPEVYPAETKAALAEVVAAACAR